MKNLGQLALASVVVLVTFTGDSHAGGATASAKFFEEPAFRAEIIREFRESRATRAALVHSSPDFVETIAREREIFERMIAGVVMKEGLRAYIREHGLLSEAERMELERKLGSSSASERKEAREQIRSRRLARFKFRRAK